MTDWYNIAVTVGQNWQEFADWAMKHGLDYPQRVIYNDPKDTYKYEGSFWIEDSDGNVVAKYCSQIPVSNRTGKVVTAFPKSSSLPIGQCG